MESGIIIKENPRIIKLVKEVSKTLTHRKYIFKKSGKTRTLKNK